MTANRELEIKYRLENINEYNLLCASLGEPDTVREQMNHYFRSRDGRVPGDRGVIRLRVEKGRAVLTVKLGGFLEAGLVDSDEYEEPWSDPDGAIPPDPDRLWAVGHPGMQVLEETFGERVPLVWIGRMVNLRKVYRVPGDLEIEVDASTYPDGHGDFEVELETRDPERDRPLLRRYLDDSGVSYGPQEETKYQRFLKHAPAGAP